MFERLLHASLAEWGTLIFCGLTILWGILAIIIKATGKIYNITPFPPKRKSTKDITMELEQIMGKDLFKKTTTMIKKAVVQMDTMQYRQKQSKDFIKSKGIVLEDDMFIIGDIYLTGSWDLQDPRVRITAIHYIDSYGEKKVKDYPTNL